MNTPRTIVGRDELLIGFPGDEFYFRHVPLVLLAEKAWRLPSWLRPLCICATWISTLSWKQLWKNTERFHFSKNIYFSKPACSIEIIAGNASEIEENMHYLRLESSIELFMSFRESVNDLNSNEFRSPPSAKHCKRKKQA